MNWGHSIVIAAALFMGYIIFLVSRCMQQDIDLVDKHYYREEIEYQKKIEKEQNSVSEDLNVLYKPENQQLAIQFPKDVENVKGNIQLFRPSDIKMDKVFKITPDQAGVQNISTSQLNPGLWRVKINWSDGSKEYFKETTLVL